MVDILGVTPNHVETTHGVQNACTTGVTKSHLCFCDVGMNEWMRCSKFVTVDKDAGHSGKPLEATGQPRKNYNDCQEQLLQALFWLVKLTSQNEIKATFDLNRWQAFKQTSSVIVMRIDRPWTAVRF